MMRTEARRRSPLEARFAAIALALVALAVAYFVLLHWWFVAPLLKVDAQMRSLEALHARYAGAIAQQPLLEQHVRRLEQGGNTAGAFLPGSDPSAAAAGLIQRATDLVASHAHEGAGCSMPSKMPVEQERGHTAFRRVSVSITLDCGIRPLAAVLHDFNRSLPYLFVDDLELARTPAGQLQAQLTLTGYLRPATASP